MEQELEEGQVPPDQVPGPNKDASNTDKPHHDKNVLAPQYHSGTKRLTRASSSRSPPPAAQRTKPQSMLAAAAAVGQEQPQHPQAHPPTTTHVPGLTVADSHSGSSSASAAGSASSAAVLPQQASAASTTILDREVDWRAPENRKVFEEAGIMTVELPPAAGDTGPREWCIAPTPDTLHTLPLLLIRAKYKLPQGARKAIKVLTFPHTLNHMERQQAESAGLSGDTPFKRLMVCFGGFCFDRAIPDAKWAAFMNDTLSKPTAHRPIHPAAASAAGTAPTDASI